MTNFNSHFCVTASTEVEEISIPFLKRYGITYFEYMRLNRDGSKFYLSSHAIRLKQLLESELSTCITQGYSLTPAAKTLLFWEDVPNMLQTKNERIEIHERINISKEGFKIDNGIVIITPRDNYVEFFNFASHPSKKNIRSFYLNNQDILTQFSYYFKEKAHNLIQESKKHPIVFRGPGAYHDLPTKNFTEPEWNPEVKRYFITDNLYLSRREYQCLKLIQKGFSSKKIAGELKLSHRTVEAHIKNTKVKFNVNFLSELLDKCYQYDL